MIGVIKGLFYMIIALFIAQGVNFFYNFIIFYLRKKKSNLANEDKKSLDMLQCETCKTYVSKSEAYIINGKTFCKKEHANQ